MDRLPNKSLTLEVVLGKWDKVVQVDQKARLEDKEQVHVLMVASHHAQIMVLQLVQMEVPHQVDHQFALMDLVLCAQMDLGLNALMVLNHKHHQEDKEAHQEVKVEIQVEEDNHLLNPEEECSKDHHVQTTHNLLVLTKLHQNAQIKPLHLVQTNHDLHAQTIQVQHAQMALLQNHQRKCKQLAVVNQVGKLEVQEVKQALQLARVATLDQDLASQQSVLST